MIMIREVKLNTLRMFKNADINDKDYPLWQKIAEYMNGEKALVIKSKAHNGNYVFLSLINEDKNKELFYMMEQDSMTGTFINDRQGFNKAWDNGEYEREGFLCLEEEYLILEESGCMSS